MLVWELFIESITDKLRMFCMLLAFAVPYSVYKINNYLHEKGDPPWKRDKAEDK